MKAATAPVQLFPVVEEPGEGDLRVISRQIRRAPKPRVYVCRRCPHGRPAVIMTFAGKAARPRTPPLLWLCCPSAAREAARLESEGFMKEVAERLSSDRESLERFMREEGEFDRFRQAALARECGELAASRAAGRGVAGGPRGAVKCLHAHVAFCLALGGESGGDDPGAIVGWWCLEELRGRAGAWCEREPAACID